MFVIYINDLPTSVKHALVRIFADDTKMYKEVPSYAVHSEVQSDLNELENWSDRQGHPKLMSIPMTCEAYRGYIG